MTSGAGRPNGEPTDGPATTRIVVGRRSWAVPAIAVVALAIVLVGVLGQKPVIPPRPSPDASVAPSATLRPVDIAWTTVPLDPAAFQLARIGLLISGPHGLLALGQDAVDRHPITWTSPDGQAWTRHDQPPGTFGGGVPDRAVSLDTGFIALGYHATADGTTREFWTSADGATWAHAQSPTGRGFTGITSLVTSGETAVLVADIGGRQVLLSSRDGQVWAETPDLDATLGNTAYIASAAGSESGYLAVGAIGTRDNAMWRSSDGRDWTPVTPADPAVLAGAHLYEVFSTHAGFLAEGYSEEPSGGQPSAWVSTDGVSWAEVQGATGFGRRNATTVLPFSDGNVIVSNNRSFGGGISSWDLRVSIDPGSWIPVQTPTDGPLDWTRQAVVVADRLIVIGWEAQANAVAAWSGRLVRDVPAAGGTPALGEPSAAQSSGASPSATGTVTPPTPPASTDTLSWHQLESREVFEDPVMDLSLSGAVEFGPDLIGFGSAGASAGLWRSTDANHWQRLPVPPAMRGAWIRAATTFRGRLVAIGAIASPDGTATPTAWTSADGTSWTRARAASDWQGVELIDIAAGPDGLVAVGRRETEQGAGAWTSSDGSTWTPLPPTSGLPFGFGFMEIRAVAYGEGVFVAVGRSDEGQPNSSGAVWTSPDGRAWTKVDGATVFGSTGASPSQREVALSDVVNRGPGFVAVGTAVGSSGMVVGAIFTSRTGFAWTRVAVDDGLEASEPTMITTWSGGLAVGANVRGYGWGHPAIWTSSDGSAWVPADLAEFATDLGAPHVPGDEFLSALAGVDGGLIGVGSVYRPTARGGAGVWVGARGDDPVADHVCPVRIDSLALLASLTGADRAACIREPVKVAALARAGTNDCGDFEGVPDLSGCGPYLELAPIEGGGTMLSLPLDASLVGVFDVAEFSPWTITVRTGLVRDTCLTPVASPNGVVYEPGEAVYLQCQAIMRVVGEEPIRRR
jgi:hypothetical protein